MKRLVIVALGIFTASCASLGPTPAQLKAMQGSSSSLCVTSPGWNGSTVQVHSASFGGKATGTGGGGGEATCGNSTVKFNNEGRAAPKGTQ